MNYYIISNIFRNLSNQNIIFSYSKVFEWWFIIIGIWNTNFSSTRFKDCYDYIELRCRNMNKCNKISAFPILKEYYTKLSFNFIICSNEKSLSAESILRFFKYYIVIIAMNQVGEFHDSKTRYLFLNPLKLNLNGNYIFFFISVHIWISFLMSRLLTFPVVYF